MGRILALASLLVLAAAIVPFSNANVCATASGCEFWDGNYHEYTLYEVDTGNVDVLIVPPATPQSGQDAETARMAIQAWDDGINALGAPWFADGVTIRTYVLGTDDPPQEALLDPEIIVVAAEYNPVLLFGIGEQAPASICRARGGALATFPTHQHDGLKVMAAECADGGITCVALNTNFLLADIFQGRDGQRLFYDLVAHEFGHCLGTGHVGDAGDFDARTVPLSDIMSYNDVPSHVHCVSTLNVRSLEGIFAEALGGPAAPLAPGSYLAMAPSAYSQVACPNP